MRKINEEEKKSEKKVKGNDEGGWGGIKGSRERGKKKKKRGEMKTRIISSCSTLFSSSFSSPISFSSFFLLLYHLPSPFLFFPLISSFSVSSFSSSFFLLIPDASHLINMRSPRPLLKSSLKTTQGGYYLFIWFRWNYSKPLVCKPQVSHYY